MHLLVGFCGEYAFCNRLVWQSQFMQLDNSGQSISLGVNVLGVKMFHISCYWW